MAEAATIARPYAKAAFMSARETKSFAEWSQALRAGAAFLAHPGAPALLTNPQLTADRVMALFAGLGGKDIDARWQNFVHLLSHNKRLEVLPQIAAQYEVLRAQHENQLEVAVTSAVVMSEAHRRKLAAALKTRFKRDVRMTHAVDPGLLGGAVIRAGDLVIDGSIHGRLRRMASELTH